MARPAPQTLDELRQHIDGAGYVAEIEELDGGRRLICAEYRNELGWPAGRWVRASIFDGDWYLMTAHPMCYRLAAGESVGEAVSYCVASSCISIEECFQQLNMERMSSDFHPLSQ